MRCICACMSPFKASYRTCITLGFRSTGARATRVSTSACCDGSRSVGSHGCDVCNAASPPPALPRPAPWPLRAARFGCRASREAVPKHASVRYGVVRMESGGASFLPSPASACFAAFSSSALLVARNE